MKKFTLLFSILILSFNANAQFSENFDAAAAIPTGWTIINAGGANGFVFGPGSVGSAFSAPNAAQINYDAVAHDDYLITPQITVTAGVSDQLTYYVKSQDPAYLETYEVVLSTFGLDAVDFSVVLTPAAEAASAWTQFTIDLTPYVGQSIYIGFHATGTDEFRLLFDDVVNGTAPLIAPGCAALVAPVNAATDVVATAPVVLSWTAPTSGGSVSTYDVFLGTTANPTTLLVNTSSLSTTLLSVLSVTTYYWKVIAKNSVGAAIGCSEFSFTTGINPFSPYCGPLAFATDVEPITSVDFAGIINPSSAVIDGSDGHELYLSSIAAVALGTSYPIVLKGNTGGNFTNRFIVFIDWNQNNILNDAGEVYFNGPSPIMTILNSTGIDAIQASGTIAVPSTALLGNTRMRVKKIFGTTNFIAPCLGAAYGQVEDYTVNVTPNLASNSFEAFSLKTFPNPIKDILNINYDKNISKIVISNLLGQEVLSKELNTNNAKIDLSTLSSGSYLVKVASENEVKTIKIIKE